MAAGVNQNVTSRPFVRSCCSEFSEIVTTAAERAPSARTTGTATAAVPLAVEPNVVDDARTACVARSSASERSPLDVLAITVGPESVTSTIVSVRSIGALSTSSWRSAVSAAVSTGSARSSKSSATVTAMSLAVSKRSRSTAFSKTRISSRDSMPMTMAVQSATRIASRMRSESAPRNFAPVGRRCPGEADAGSGAIMVEVIGREQFVSF